MFSNITFYPKSEFSVYIFLQSKTLSSEPIYHGNLVYLEYLVQKIMLAQRIEIVDNTFIITNVELTYKFLRIFHNYKFHSDV